MIDYLILVDENDNPQGKLEKLLVHQQGLLHRAFSVYIFNTKGELLLQQRADEKYHSAGLWTNTTPTTTKISGGVTISPVTVVPSSFAANTVYVWFNAVCSGNTATNSGASASNIAFLYTVENGGTPTSGCLQG